MQNFLSCLNVRFLDGFRTLVFPEICIMCQEREGKLCENCAELWNVTPRHIGFREIPTFSSVIYSPLVSSVVLKAKEERNAFARQLLALALFRSIRELMQNQRVGKFVLVPVPSSPNAVRKRGESFLQPILNQVISIASKDDQDWQWHELLYHRKKVRDQAGLNYQKRQENLDGAFYIRNLVSLSLPIILVDDVITTGSTLRNAFMALNERKMTVLGAATACASPHQFLIR